MTPTKVYFEKIFPVAPYENYKAAIEGTIDPGETYEHALLKAYEEVINGSQKLPIQALADPALFQVPTPIVVEKPLTEDQRVATLISDIYSCKEIKVLESYKLLVKTNKLLQEAYDQQYKKLIK